jgi:hypothetical protein
MFLLEIESMEIDYDLSVRRHNRERHNVLHQAYFNEISRLSLLKKLEY